MKIWSAVFFSLIFIAGLIGCVQMRDYTGVRDGAAGLDIKNQFGPGESTKDYYVVDAGDGIVIGDTKDEVIAQLGLPDEVATTLEGYETWIYKARSLKLFFSGDRFREWQEF
ncbi:MAG: hypothetical protein KKH93_06365 [Candidatus Omnitrophica bacterium]|nr:hypothetical protein [Candidatus Omnitrophota bacterium]MBU2043712.1 hypothetical protein [Candidatus Omnitrophota bacterium]MBU2250895.1 hypothetical protein [Candidatus Omnitrophota bacterium]MBU2265998.1 hypothetical protein [Candidatus Omnitrophota bacterium]MBU2474022.1 hypothetical protein [Candidatus Omnitrophota bacterium]